MNVVEQSAASRDEIQLGKPRPVAELVAWYPRWQKIEPKTWFRAHSNAHHEQSDRGCWWFASCAPDDTGGGRFDLPAPDGTCYLADDVEAAVRERLGPAWGSHPFLPQGALAGTTVSGIELAKYLTASTVADTNNPDAAGFTTRELSSGARYSLTRRHAAAFAAAGFTAIRYEPRFTPGAVQAIALFGEAGRPDPPRLAEEVPDWRSMLRSPVRARVSRTAAQVLEPPELPGS